MKKYRIRYCYLKPDGSLLTNQVTPWNYNRDESNNLWKEMKNESCFVNMTPEIIDEETVERHIVTVAFKTYDYIVEGPIKKGQYVKVISGGNIVKLKVLELDPPKKEGIRYKLVERVC